jgi:hypothetical protein
MPLRVLQHPQCRRTIVCGDVLYSGMDAPFMTIMGPEVDGRKRRSSIPAGWILVASILLIFLVIPFFAAAQASPAGFEELVANATAARDQNDVPRAIQLYGQAVQGILDA